MSDALKFEEIDGQIGVLTYDVPDKKVNTLSKAIVQELAAHVDTLEQHSDLRGLLFRSGKPGQFIAGADLNELGAMAYATREQVDEAISAGHALFDRISRLPFPTVALIDGNCMGGGTELVLSMDYRIASDSSKTKIALPEVKVGLIPGWGGTQRLPRLIGINYAIEMITSGEPAGASDAVAHGLVFDAVPAERLIEEGCRLIEFAQESGEWKENRTTRSQPLGLTEDQANFAFAIAEGVVRSKTKGQYPAPLAALKAITDGVNRTLDEGLAIERELALDVVGSPISASLIGVFFMQNQLSRDSGIEAENIEPRDVNRIGVLGAGLMGAGIATAHARRGVPAVIVDVDNEQLAAGLGRARHVIESRLKIGRATPQDMADMLSLLNTSTSKEVYGDCDVVIEAVPEIESLKTKMYAELTGVMRDDAILASNTSTISITRMAESAPNAERFIGMHYFSPVDRMQLVEVIRGEKTTDETTATIVALAKRIGKTPIVVNDCPGFLVNRVLLPYMNESLLLLQEGADMDAIDKAATKFGMPVGPIALNDMVGIDVAYYAGKVVAEAYSDRAVASPILADLVETGRLGKKSGAGFRKFAGKKGRPSPDPDFAPFLEKHRTGTKEFSAQEIEDRLFLPLLLETTRCLEDNIVREPAHADMGLILGIGFPPFRGGILRWCDTVGAAQIIEKLKPYASLGKRFEPTDSLKQLAETNCKFYPQPKEK